MKLRILHIQLICLSVAVAAQARAADPTLSELFLQVDPAVVEIATIQQVVADQGPARRVSSGSLGSGFLISSDGQIMTAAHVVQLADKLSVRFVTGDVVTARVVASDPSADVALIKVESVPAGIKPATLGDSDATKIGDEVFVIGAPFGISHSLTVGYVSGRRTPDKLFGGFETVELLQTDAAINEGNSGGPMFNMRGEAIGIVSHILSSSGGFQGIGFVVTSNLAKHLLLDDPTPWTGLHGVLLEGPLARALNIPQKAGTLVEGVAAGSPASAIGLRPGNLKAQIAGQTLTIGGDIILAVNGILVGSPDFSRKISDTVRALTGDDRLVLRVLRDGDVIELSKPVSVLGFDR
jgi:serine protease Do